MEGLQEASPTAKLEGRGLLGGQSQGASVHAEGGSEGAKAQNQAGFVWGNGFFSYGLIKAFSTSEY